MILRCYEIRKKEAGKKRKKEAGINAASWILDVYIIIDIH